MLIADTSAWVEWLRATGSPAHLAFREVLRDDLVLLPEPVRAELLFGARDRDEEIMLERLFESVEHVLLTPRDDFEATTELHLRARRAGVTVRDLLDCLVVAMAARLEVALLHHDRDLARLAPVAGVAQADGSLRIDPPATA
jgi:predicted nucleic acid-binding protein